MGRPAFVHCKHHGILYKEPERGTDVYVYRSPFMIPDAARAREVKESGEKETRVVKEVRGMEKGWLVRTKQCRHMKL